MRACSAIALAGGLIGAVACPVPVVDGPVPGPSTEVDPPPLDPALDQALEELLVAQLDAAQSPGLVVGVALGKALWVGSAGDSAGSGQPPDPDGLFRVGSVSKTWIAAGVHQLASEGWFSLADPISLWFPDIEYAEEIQVLDLLGHTSGIFNYSDDLSLFARLGDVVAPRELVAIAAERGPQFIPGDSYDYSNTNYVLLGLIIEEVAGATRSEWIRGQFLDPLGLESVFTEGPEVDYSDLVPGHLGGTVVTSLQDPSWSWCAGDMVASAADATRWAQALMGGHAVSPGIVRELRVRGTLNDGSRTSYGAGLMPRNRSGIAVAGHTGATMGFQADLFATLDGEAAVVVLTDDFVGEPSAVARAVWRLLADSGAVQ